MNAPLANPRRHIPDGMHFTEWRARDGWPLRSFSWPQPGAARGSLLFLTGRGDFIEKYLEVLIHWHRAGWTIAGFDWRGQGGSGRMLADPLICHQSDFDILVADLAGFVDHWIAETTGPHVIVAHSMGAHLTLRMLAERPQGIDAAVLNSAMIGIRVKGVPPWLVGALVRSAVAVGLSDRRISRRDIGDVGGRMTSCPDRRADKMWWKATRPELASGVPSWSWVRAAFASIARLTDTALGQIRTPILLTAARADPIVDVGAIEHAARVLPYAELTIIEGGGHEILREVDARRLPLLARIDEFLDRIA
ncbi:MAG: alpha/beta hydrolase [Sphingomonas sp.]|nr:alpha/beta hydrolase [Sphingomonas sp.]